MGLNMCLKVQEVPNESFGISVFDRVQAGWHLRGMKIAPIEVIELLGSPSMRWAMCFMKFYPCLVLFAFLPSETLQPCAVYDNCAEYETFST